jgi:photosystem II stability/assembly factor-like uncharacterized protein
MDFIFTSTGYFVGDGGLILKTVDGGKSFAQKASGPGPLKSVRFFDADRGIAVGAGGTALCTADRGAHWILGGTGTDAPLMDVRMISATTAYAGGGSTLIKTLDGGRTWSPVKVDDIRNPRALKVGDGLLFDGKQFAMSD